MRAGLQSDSAVMQTLGSVALSYPMMPELGCLLQALDVSGCRGTVMFQYLPEHVSEAWKRCLGPNRPVHLKINACCGLSDFEIDAVVKNIDARPDCTAITMHFHKATLEQLEALDRAVTTLSAHPRQTGPAPKRLDSAIFNFDLAPVVIIPDITPLPSASGCVPPSRRMSAMTPDSLKNDELPNSPEPPGPNRPVEPASTPKPAAPPAVKSAAPPAPISPAPSAVKSAAQPAPVAASIPPSRTANPAPSAAKDPAVPLLTALKAIAERSTPSTALVPPKAAAQMLPKPVAPPKAAQPAVASPPPAPPPPPPPDNSLPILAALEALAGGPPKAAPAAPVAAPAHSQPAAPPAAPEAAENAGALMAALRKLGGGTALRAAPASAVPPARPVPPMPKSAPKTMPIPPKPAAPAAAPMPGPVHELNEAAEAGVQPAAKSPAPSHSPRPAAGPAKPASEHQPPPAPPAPAPRSPEAPASPRKRFGAVLVQMGKLTQEQVESAAEQARMRAEKLGIYLVHAGLITPDVLCRALSIQTRLPMTDLSQTPLPPEYASLLPFALMSKHKFVVFDAAEHFVCIAAANPLAMQSIAELEHACGRKVELFLGREDLIRKELDRLRLSHKGLQAERRFIRYDISVPLTYRFCGRLGEPLDDKPHEGSTVNISEGGLLIEGSSMLFKSPDEMIRSGTCLNVTMTDYTHVMRAICRLKTIRAKKGTTRVLFCVEIADMAQEDRRRLKELCVKSLVKKLKPDA